MKTIIATGASLALLLGIAPEIQAVEETFVIKGSVNDELKRPVKGVPVTLRQSAGGRVYADKTDSRGNFHLEHKGCDHCVLEIKPALTSGLCSANLANIPGRQSRQFVVQLKRGLPVSGRITSGGKGLKGLIIEARAKETHNSDSVVHGGGATTTSGDGRFILTLTPGAKVLVVKNQRYSRLIERIERTLMVGPDHSALDIVLTERLSAIAPK